MFIFSHRRTQSNLPLILIRGIPIPLLELVKLLGHRFQSNHSIDPAYENQKKQNAKKS